MRRDTLLYGGAFVLFGGVVLWAAEAPPAVIGVAIALGAALLLVAAVTLRPAPMLLLVGRSATALEPVRRLVRGYRVRPCAGPSDGPCPVLLGRPCPAGPEPIAALVVRSAGERGPLAPCGRALRIPEIVIEEGSDRELEVRGPYARVGLERGSQEVRLALETMLLGRAA